MIDPTPVSLPDATVATLTPPAAITNFASETGGNLASIAAEDFATQATLALIKAKTDNIPAQGQALASASTPVVLTAAQMTTLTPIAGNLEATQLLVKAKTDNIDVALSTRLKPADTLAGVTTVTAVTAITNALPAGTNAIGKLAANSGVDIGDVDVTTLPAITIAAAQTLTTVTTVGAVTAITNALPAGTNAIGKLSANSGVDIGDVDVTSLPALPTGTNNIGDVDVLTLPALVAGSANIGDVDVLTVPALIAGTARIGGVYPVGGQQIDEGGTVRAVSRAFVNAVLIGNTAVVAAQGAGVKIRVLSAMAVGTLAVTIKFQSATTDITAGFPLGINGGMVLPYNPHGWFETAANEALNINLGLGTATGVNITWCPAV